MTLRNAIVSLARLVVITVAAFILLSCSQSGGDASASKAAQGETAAPQPAAVTKTVVAPLSLGELPDAVARLEALREEVAKALIVDDAERRAASQLDTTLRRIDRSRQHVDVLPLDELNELSRRLAATDRQVAITGSDVEARLRRVEEDLRRADDLKKKFDEFAKVAEQTAAPVPITVRVRMCRAQLDDLSVRLTQRRTEILVLVDKLTEAKGGVAAMTAIAESRLVETRRQLSALSEEPIWRLRFRGRDLLMDTADRLARDIRRIRRWVAANLLGILLITVVCFGGMVVLLRRFHPSEVGDENDPAVVASMRLRASPWAAGIPVTVIAILLFSPQPPAIIYDLAWLIAAPAAALVVVRLLGSRVARTVWVLAASLAITPFESIVAALPVAARIVLILQTAPLAVVLARDLTKGRLYGPGMEGRPKSWFAAVLWFLVICLGTAAAGSLLGWVGLASILSAGALGTLGGIIVTAASYLVLSVVLRNVLVSAVARGLRIVREHAALVGRTCLGALRVTAVLIVSGASIESFGLQHSVRALFSGIFGAKVTLGSMTVSAGAVVGFALVFAISLLLARLIGFLLAEEFLPRFDVRRGTAHAITATTRYLVLLAGFVLAAGFAGIDLTKFGFIAGALGVGVGFGLQNIVSNFISGLILLFERPIQVGDVVDVSGATGSVTEIGIRASIVHTFDGSEVIVPNADLISKPVTNWTRTHSNRRFDISVGVAYGTPLETTARALLEAARRTAGILPAPAPEAFFKSFGPSALEWTLRVWVRMDESPQVLSALKRAMSEELEKAKIHVPFPQRDIHIRTVVASVEGVLNESNVHV